MAVSATGRLVAPAAPSRFVMRGTLRVVLLAVVGLLAVAAIAVPLLARSWPRETEAARVALTAAVPASLPPVSLASIDALPAPVQRYLRLALRDGQPRPAVVTLEQA